jgi:uncharacterized membrane protein YhaH (DUF805 family)
MVIVQSKWVKTMNFVDAISSAFSDYFKFSGRSLRSEYWYFQLFCLVGSFLLTFLDAAISDYPTWTDFNNSDEIGLTGGIFALGTLIPFIAVTARRFHDIGRTGWWMLIPLTIIGIIPYLYWMCQAGDKGTNKYGDIPLGSARFHTHKDISTSHVSAKSLINHGAQILPSSAVPDTDPAGNTLKKELNKIEELFKNSLITEEERQRMRDKALGIDPS